MKLAHLTSVGGSSANTNILYTAFKGWSLTLNCLQKLFSPAGVFRGALTRELEFAQVVVHEPRDEGKCMGGDGGHKTIHWANVTVFFQRVLENYDKTEPSFPEWHPTKFYTERLCPEVQLFTLNLTHHFCQKRYPFCMTFIDKWYRLFHIQVKHTTSLLAVVNSPSF